MVAVESRVTSIAARRLSSRCLEANLCRTACLRHPTPKMFNLLRWETPIQPSSQCSVTKIAFAALDWLAKAFGLHERRRLLIPDGRVRHAEMETDGGVIMLASSPLATRAPRDGASGTREFANGRRFRG